MGFMRKEADKASILHKVENHGNPSVKQAPKGSFLKERTGNVKPSTGMAEGRPYCLCGGAAALAGSLQ